MINHTRTMISGIVLGTFLATVLTSAPLWAADAPSVPVACLCFKAKDKFSPYQAHMVVDEKTRPIYESLIKANSIWLGKHVRLVPSTCTPKIAEALRIKNFGCTQDLYHTSPVTVRIRSTSGIPLKDDANKKNVLDMAKWPKTTSIGISGKKSK